jgi:hypothetical protein
MIFYYFLLLLVGWDWAHLVRRPLTGLLYQPWMIHDGDCGPVSGMKIGSEHRSTRRKPAPAPLCPPQIPLDETRARTRAAAMARPHSDDTALHPECKEAQFTTVSSRAAVPVKRDVVCTARKGIPRPVNQWEGSTLFCLHAQTLWIGCKRHCRLPNPNKVAMRWPIRRPDTQRECGSRSSAIPLSYLLHF